MDANFDAELVALSQAIATEKIAIGPGHEPLPQADKEQLRAALTEKIQELLPQGTPATATDDATVPPPTTNTTVQKGQVGSKSYLDAVDDATVAKVNAYIAQAFQNGIQSTLRAVITEDPFILDVFHDALTDKLYAELKTRGMVK